jgi:hypothetical protein
MLVTLVYQPDEVLLTVPRVLPADHGAVAGRDR